MGVPMPSGGCWADGVLWSGAYVASAEGAVNAYECQRQSTDEVKLCKNGFPTRVS
jgi:hypothetical protein